MPPPPVWGAAVGKAVLAGGVVGRIVVTDGLGDGDAGAEDDAGAGDDACADTDGEERDEPDGDVCGEPDADAAAEELPGDREACPVGEAVRAPDCEPDCAPVCGVWVKVDGADPPGVQAETAAATRAAPAAERPTVSHAPRAPPGLVRRIFTNPPRMRVR